MPGGSEPSGQDQRAHPRVPLVLSAVLATGGLEYPAVVIDISAGGAGLQYLADCPAAGMIGQLNIAGFGGFDGITVRDGGDFRGLRFLHGEAERLALLPKLIRYIEKGLGDDEPPLRAQLTLTRINGMNLACDVENISINGVVLRTSEPPAVGELVRMGRMYGRVSRHLPGAINVRFLSFVAQPGVAPVPSLQG